MSKCKRIEKRPACVYSTLIRGWEVRIGKKCRRNLDFHPVCVGASIYSDDEKAVLVFTNIPSAGGSFTIRSLGTGVADTEHFEGYSNPNDKGQKLIRILLFYDQRKEGGHV